MAARRTAWHFFFGLLLRDSGPAGMEQWEEVLLSEEPPRIDYLLLRTPELGAEQEGQARTLRRLWPELPRVTVMGLRWEAFGPGYWRVRGGLFALFVVEIDVAAPADQDEVLYSFGHGGRASLAARRFWSDVLKRGDVEMNVQEMDDFDEVVEKLALRLPPQKLLAHFPPEQRMAGLPPEQRMAGLPPEQRLAGLDRDHAVLALPIEMLRALSEDYIRSLSPEAQAEIQRRLGKNGHAGPPPNGR